MRTCSSSGETALGVRTRDAVIARHRHHWHRIKTDDSYGVQTYWHKRFRKKWVKGSGTGWRGRRWWCFARGGWC